MSKWSLVGLSFHRLRAGAVIRGGTLETSSCSTEKQLDLGLSTGPGGSGQMFLAHCVDGGGREEGQLNEEDPESEPKMAKKKQGACQSW